MESLISGALLSISLCLDIGIVNVAILDTGIKRGLRAALLLAIGSCVGDLVYAALSAAGVSWLLHFRAVQWTIWLFGTTVLLWLAFKMAREAWRDAQRPRDEALPPMAIPPGEGWRLFRRGALMAMASPSAILWFAAVGSGLIAQATAGALSKVMLFLTGFFLGGVAWSCLLALLAAVGGAHLGRGLRRGCHLASAGLFIYFAMKVGWHGYVDLIR